MGLHVSVDTDECVGHGRCYEIAPDVFRADDHGHSVVISAHVADALADVARQAAAACPEEAIAISER